MKHRFYPFLLLFSFFSLSVFAQESFSPGKVYTLPGDTLSGLISSQRTARFIKFKSASGERTSFAPTQIKGFEYKGNIYLAKEAETEFNGVTGKEFLFMEQLVRGRVNLYYYKEPDNSKHYWAEKDTILYELRSVEKEVEKDGVKYLKKGRQYLGILSFLFEDCDSYKVNLNDIVYNHDRLTGAIYRYNTCFESEKPKVLHKRERFVVHPGIKGGRHHFSQANTTGQYGYFFGAFANMPLTGASRMLSVQLEATYNQYQAGGAIYAYNYKLIDLAIHLRATAPRGFVRPYGSIGVVRSSGNVKVTDPYRRIIPVGRQVFYKLAPEAGLQFPVGRQYIYGGARYEHVLGEKYMRYRIWHLAVGIGF